MGFYEYIENLKSKPEHVRRRAAFWYSFGITAVIFAIWLTSFSNITLNPGGNIRNTVAKTSTPAQSLVAAVDMFAGNIKDLIFGPKKIQYSEVKVSPGKR